MELEPLGRPGLFRGPAAYLARTPWSPLAAILATISIVGASVVGASFLLLRSPELMSPGGSATSTWRQDITALGTLGVWQAVAIALTLLASRMFGGRLRTVLALRSPGPASIYLKAVLLMAALQVVVSVAEAFLVQDIYADMRPFVRLFGEQWLLALLVVGVGAPLSEELLFRGFLLSALAQSRLGFAGGAAVSTALWTALHAGYSSAGMVEVFLIGLFFSWLLWRTGSLLVPIFCHALYNSLVVLVLRHVPLPN